MTKIANKLYIVTFIVLFVISTAILLIASTAKTALPVWGGYLDVGLVVLIAFTGITIHQRNKTAPRYDISHQVAVYVSPAVLVGMWLYRDSIDFNILPHGLNLWNFEQPQ
jgi:uncharacterized membrane protein YkvI